MEFTQGSNIKKNILIDSLCMLHKGNFKIISL